MVFCESSVCRAGLSSYPQAKSFNNWLHASSEASYNGTPLPLLAEAKPSPSCLCKPPFTSSSLKGWFPHSVTHKPPRTHTQTVARADVAAVAYATGFVFIQPTNGALKICSIRSPKPEVSIKRTISTPTRCQGQQNNDTLISDVYSTNIWAECRWGEKQHRDNRGLIRVFVPGPGGRTNLIHRGDGTPEQEGLFCLLMETGGGGDAAARLQTADLCESYSRPPPKSPAGFFCCRKHTFHVHCDDDDGDDDDKSRRSNNGTNEERNWGRCALR